MCIRDSYKTDPVRGYRSGDAAARLAVRARAWPTRCRSRDRPVPNRCLLYTSDAADERSSVDLGGRRIIKKNKKNKKKKTHKKKTTNKMRTPHTRVHNSSHTDYASIQPVTK